MTDSVPRYLPRHSPLVYSMMQHKVVCDPLVEALPIIFRNFKTHASTSLLLIWFVAVAFRSEEEVFLKKGTPVTYFASPWIRPWANMAKHLYACAIP